MALLLLGRTRCALCDEILKVEDQIVATSHFIPDETDQLWRFSDAGMHRHCFLTWELRGQFVSRYNKTVGHITWGNGTYHHMTDEGEIQSLPRNP